MKPAYRSSSSLPLIFLLFSLSSAHNPESRGNFKGCFSQVYAFGGSGTDTGNAHFLGALPGGDDSDSSSSPVGNSTSRLSDGRLVVDFLCEALSLPVLPPYKGPDAGSTNGVNFAVAGSTALSTDFYVSHNVSSLIWNSVPIGFQTQIEWFNTYLINAGCKGSDARSCKVDMERSLFWIGEMGVSDYISALHSSVPPPHLADMSARSVCKLLKALLDNGAKNVVVQGLPPVGCFPAYMSSNSQQKLDYMGCVATANKGVMDHNQILQHKLKTFRKLYPKCSILYADYWNAYLTILMNPKRHHIEETFKPCCSHEGKFTFDLPSLSGSINTSICKDPQNFISWDGIHLTEAMNKNLADLFLNQGFCRPSFSELVRSKRIT
ncbi:hypothetical protein C2S51_035203 [Perilla frutescens var. frutescens]|nr:hypothetical protein C2S51_035203 [Perilla frutescens var. frutescens]